MLKAIRGDYEIHVFEEHYRGSFVDCPVRYSNVHIKDDECSSITCVGLVIYKNEEQINSALIGNTGGAGGVNKSTVIFEEERIVACCCDAVFCLSIPELSLLWETKCDLATCFQIFPYQNNYIVHGELEITRLDDNGKIVWQFSAKDIFSGKFEITSEYILATDWDNDEFKLDFDGNLLD